MTREYSLVPQPVARVETRYRRIVTDLPAPESIPRSRSWRSSNRGPCAASRRWCGIARRVSRSMTPGATGGSIGRAAC